MTARPAGSASSPRSSATASGRALRLVGADCDVTAQALAQATLRESEERFRLIADSAPVPVWVTKLDRTRSFANQAYLDFLGLPFEEAIVFDWRKRLHPDDQQRVVQESIAGEASLKPFVLEARYLRADNEWRWLRSESQPRWDPTGSHIGFIGVAHDITAAKQAEHDLRRLNEILELRITERTAQLESSEAQMRAIFETSHQYQSLLNLHGDVLYANKTALAGIRTDASEVIGKPFWETPWFSATAWHARHRPRRLHRRDAGRRNPDRDAAASADRRSLFRLRDAPAAQPARRDHRRGAGGHRRHRTPPGRGSAAPVAEDGSGRTIDRRRGARFQQSLDHHPLRDRFPAPPRTAGRAAPALHRRDCRDGGARLQADRTIAGVRPQAAPEAAGIQCRHPGRGGGATDPPAGRRPDQDRRRHCRPAIVSRSPISRSSKPR